MRCNLCKGGITPPPVFPQIISLRVSCLNTRCIILQTLLGLNTPVNVLCLLHTIIRTVIVLCTIPVPRHFRTVGRIRFPRSTLEQFPAILHLAKLVLHLKTEENQRKLSRLVPQRKNDDETPQRLVV